MIRALICLFTVSFSTAAVSADFASDFRDTSDRVWVGPRYWANPMEDWSINDGRLECRGGGNRNLALLTHTLTGRSAFQMTVRLGRLTMANAVGSVGFRIGVRDEINDYRAAALRGVGLDVGISATTGTLFIGKVTGGKLSAIGSLDDLTLTLVGKPVRNRIVLSLAAVDPRGKALASVESAVSAEQVRGLVALVNNHGSKDRPAFWFSNWQLTGTGVKSHDERAWGPILWTMHTLHHTHTSDGVVLKLTAQLAPMGEQGPKTAKLRVSNRDSAIEARIDPLACNGTFRIAGWDPTSSANYTVDCGGAVYTGTIRAEPSGRPLVVAGFTGNQDYVFPNNAVARNDTLPARRSRRVPGQHLGRGGHQRAWHPQSRQGRVCRASHVRQHGLPHPVCSPPRSARPNSQETGHRRVLRTNGLRASELCDSRGPLLQEWSPDEGQFLEGATRPRDRHEI